MGAPERDFSYSGFASENLWPMVGGEGLVADFVSQVEGAGGEIYLGGGSLREATRASFRQPVKLGDLDILCGGVDLEELEEIARRVWNDDGPFLVTKKEKRLGGPKTLQVVAKPNLGRKGRIVADLVPLGQQEIESYLAKRDIPPNSLALPLGIDEQGQLTLGALIDYHDGVADIQAGRVRSLLPELPPANALRIFRFWVGVGDLEEEDENVLRNFPWRGRLVAYRQPLESLAAWKGRIEALRPGEKLPSFLTNQRSSLVRILVSPRAEEVIAELWKAAKADPIDFWDNGWQIGLIPALFPVLELIEEKTRREIRQRLEDLKPAGQLSVELYGVIFKPVFDELLNKLFDNPDGSPALVEIINHLRFYLNAECGLEGKDYQRQTEIIIAQLKERPLLLLDAISNFFPWETLGIYLRRLAREWI